MASLVFEMDANVTPIKDKAEEIKKLLEKSNAYMIQKMEKMCLVMKDIVERSNFYMQIMLRRMSTYFKEMLDKFSSSMKDLLEVFKSEINKTCSNFEPLRSELDVIKKDIDDIEEFLKKGSWNKYIATITFGLLGIGAALIGIGGGFELIGIALLGIGAIVPQIYGAFRFRDWILDVTDLRKAIYDFASDSSLAIAGSKLAKKAGISEFIKELDGFIEKLKTGKLGYEDFSAVIANTSDPFAKSASAIDTVTEGLTDLANEIDVIQKKSEAVFPLNLSAEATGLLGAREIVSAGAEAVLMPLKDDFKNFYDDITSFEKDAQQKSLTGWKFWADSIIALFSSIYGGIKGTYESLKTGISDIFDIFKSKQVKEADPFSGLGGLSAGAEASLGKSDVGFLSKIGAALGPIGKVASIIMQIPQIVKQVWDSIKEFAKGIASLFGWMSEEEKVQKDVLRDLGAAISDDLAKKIADTSKDIGDRFTAVTLHLGDIIRETDITADNFDTFASRARDVFSLLETGMIDATQATSTLNDVFPQLADEMDKLGITFNKNMIDMIQLSRTFGLEVESIKQYVEQKLGIAITGLTNATQNLGEISQQEFDRLARAASATFNELMKNGVDVALAIDQMKEVIGNLSKVQEEFGLKGSAAFNQLKRYSNLVETNQAVIESVKGMQDVYTSLAQVGAMNQQLFKDWQMDTLANYDKLIEGGFKQNEALAMMAPNLQALKELHETMGFKIDDNTMALIKQAEAAGLLKPDPMLQMTDAVLEMKGAVYELIDYLAGKSPPCGSLIEAFDTALEYTKSYGRELINAFSPVPVELLISKIGDIPTRIGIDVAYNYDKFPGPGGGYGGGYHGLHKPYMAQHGGIFSVPTHLLVGENPSYNPEVVLNRFQLERLLNQTARPARNLSDVGNGGTTVINIHVAGEKVESVILPMLKQASRDGKMRIDARAIEE